MKCETCRKEVCYLTCLRNKMICRKCKTEELLKHWIYLGNGRFKLDKTIKLDGNYKFRVEIQRKLGDYTNNEHEKYYLKLMRWKKNGSG